MLAYVFSLCHSATEVRLSHVIKGVEMWVYNASKKYYLIRGHFSKAGWNFCCRCTTFLQLYEGSGIHAHYEITHAPLKFLCQSWAGHWCRKFCSRVTESWCGAGHFHIQFATQHIRKLGKVTWRLGFHHMVNLHRHFKHYPVKFIFGPWEVFSFFNDLEIFGNRSGWQVWQNGESISIDGGQSMQTGYQHLQHSRWCLCTSGFHWEGRGGFCLHYFEGVCSWCNIMDFTHGCLRQAETLQKMCLHISENV